MPDGTRLTSPTAIHGANAVRLDLVDGGGTLRPLTNAQREAMRALARHLDIAKRAVDDAVTENRADRAIEALATVERIGAAAALASGHIERR